MVGQSSGSVDRSNLALTWANPPEVLGFDCRRSLSTGSGDGRGT
jgi:hypothetical protein